MAGSATVILTLLTVVLVLFLVCRVAVLWYWRVNEALEIMTEIRVELAKIRGEIQKGK